MKRLEITLDQLRQSQLFLSNSLRLLVESINTDQRERDTLVHELKQDIIGLRWNMDALQEKVKRLQEELLAAQSVNSRLDSLDRRLLALEGVASNTQHDRSAAELRQDLADQLLRMATVLGTGRLEDSESSPSPLEARIRMAQDVARVLRSPCRSVDHSRASSPAPSARR